jgi:hypothetical protein
MGDNRLREFLTREKINGGPDTLGRRLSTGLSGVGFKQPVCTSQMPLSQKHTDEPGWSRWRARSRRHQNDHPGADQHRGQCDGNDAGPHALLANVPQTEYLGKIIHANLIHKPLSQGLHARFVPTCGIVYFQWVTEIENLLPVKSVKYSDTLPEFLNRINY